MAHHFLGGLWLVFVFNFLLIRFDFNLLNQAHSVTLFFIFLGLVALVGVLWEFGEFTWDRFIWHSGFTYLSGVYEDALSDLFFDLLGGVVGFFFIL